MDPSSSSLSLNRYGWISRHLPPWLPNHLRGSPEAMGSSKPPGSSCYPGDPDRAFPPLLLLPWAGGRQTPTNTSSFSSGSQGSQSWCYECALNLAMHPCCTYVPAAGGTHRWMITCYQGTIPVLAPGSTRKRDISISRVLSRGIHWHEQLEGQLWWLLGGETIGSGACFGVMREKGGKPLIWGAAWGPDARQVRWARLMEDFLHLPKMHLR